MIRMKNILVPTDFSDFSRLALDYAITIAQTFKASIILIHVTPEKELDSIRQISPYLEPGRIEELLKGRESEDRKQLNEFIPPEKKEGIETEAIHRVGTPFLEIIKVAKEKEVDLIVMATHGRSGLSHILFGSVAEKVVRKSTCPVLSIRPPEHEFTMP
jgi:nucleotide-binding universal stress UspA family protein